MKPYSKYIFIKRQTSKQFLSEFSFSERIGNVIPYFPSRWISMHHVISHNKLTRSIYRGMKGITRFNRFLLLEDADYIGLKPINELEYFYYGSFNDDAVIVKIEKYDFIRIKNITMWFFEGMHKKLEKIYFQCISGQLELD